MRFTFSAVYVTALLSTFLTTSAQAAAVPHEARSLQLEKRAPPYPNDAAIRRALTDFNGPSVFFSNLAPLTQAQRDAPDAFAETVQGRTVKRAFGNQPAPNQRKLFTDQWPGPGRSPNYQDFADRFSRIFAEQSKGDTAFVMLRALDGLEGPKLTSVWNVHELPALKANPNIKKIIRVNPADFKDQQQIFPEVTAAPPADPAAAPAAAPEILQIKPRRLGGFKLGGGGGGGGFKLGGLFRGSKTPTKVKPTKSANDPPAPPTSKAAPPPPPSSSKPPPPPPSSSNAPPPPPSSSSAPPPPPSSSSASPSPASPASSTSQSAAPSSSSAPESSAAASTSAPSSTSAAPATTSSAVVSSASGSSSSAPVTSATSTNATPSTTTTSASATSSAANRFVVLDWDNPKDGPYYNAILP